MGPPDQDWRPLTCSEASALNPGIFMRFSPFVFLTIDAVVIALDAPGTLGIVIADVVTS
jgi:hypothetical protein